MSCAPVEKEIEACHLEVKGAIPPELNGMLARIGPNRIGEV
ncbi:MAG: carotenoid oxygenase family protein [Erythrobacter sp.]|nr:carotenoid oxygenase family protein [Erythrobacter sp.]